MGIGGAGLSAIARVLHERGQTVTGSDQARTAFAAELESDGVLVSYGHEAANVRGADLVIASSAIPGDNPELVAAHEAGIPVLKREAFFGDLTAGHKTVAVAGTHGKTTTTGLIAWVLERAGLSPSFIVGGKLVDLGTNARAGKGPHFVIEADEYDRAFHGLNPSVAVVTNVEHDHPDCYPTPEEFHAAFVVFVEQVQELLLVCADDPGAASLGRQGLSRRTYGLSADADWFAEEIRPNGAGGMDYLALCDGQLLGLVRLRLPGLDNVRNSLAALAVASELGVTFVEAREAMVDFRGVGRRFEVLGQETDVTVVDDYAHHPTEIRSTLAAARSRFPEADIWAVFQPHTYSRTRTLLDALKGAFTDADHVIVLDIFAARERPDSETTGESVARQIEHPEALFIGDMQKAVEHLLNGVAPGSLVITLSAGDGNQVGRSLVEQLRKRQKGADGE